MDATVSPAIQDFQHRLRSQYDATVSVPRPYRYLYGDTVRPVVPVDVAQGSVFIIGAYPSARFATISSMRDVPVADISRPFSNERYLDGQAMRTVKSGCELDENYLKPLGLKRGDCWITNMVRVFLFKEGHIDKYNTLKCEWCPPETRSRFEEFAKQGLSLLEQELRLASPRLVITLGSEVAGILRGIKGRDKRNALLGGQLQEFNIGADKYPVIHLAHPGIVMRPATERNPWPELHKSHIALAAKHVETIIFAGPQ